MAYIHLEEATMIEIKSKKIFSEIYDSMDLSLPYRSPLGNLSLQIIYQYGLMANKVDGMAAEAGVYSGYSLYTLAHVFDREIHAFDSFEGLPEPIDIDGDHVRKGGFSMSLDMVKERLSFTDKVIYHKGFFKDILSQVDPELRFAYAFCDVDLYQSVIECFEFFYPRMNPGGILFFDDCYCDHTPGARIAIDEMLALYEVKDAFKIGVFVVVEVKND